MNSLQRFQILGLYGDRDVDITINDNTVIFVGENGLGKTTVLKYMFSVLSGVYSHMPTHKFDKIVITISNKEYTLSSNQAKTAKVINPNSIRRLPVQFRRELFKLDREDGISINDVLNIANKLNYPVKMILDILQYNSENNNNDIHQIEMNFDESHITQIPNALGARVLYLPTYRRIEEDLSYIIQERQNFRDPEELQTIFEFSERGSHSYIELVEFGMQDVKDKIKKKCSELSRYSEASFKELAYLNLGDVIDKKYRMSEQTFTSVQDSDIEKFKLCVSRNNKNMLNNKQIQLLTQILHGNKPQANETQRQILLYYFRNLLALQDELEKKEKGISDFCSMCSEYLSLSDKIMIYDISKFDVQILKQRSNEPIDMSDLSSGEKQIVSLFSHLYLQDKDELFVIIDEPELSLSVPWQKRFLCDIRNGSSCTGLIVATHSPFIYDNNLFKYAHGLKEYFING